MIYIQITLTGTGIAYTLETIVNARFKVLEDFNMANSTFTVRESLVKLTVTLSLLCCTSFASAGIILTWDGTSTSSNTPATGASASAELTFTDATGGGVKIDVAVRNTTGETTFGAGATTSKLTGVAFDLFEPNAGVSDFAAGTYLTDLIFNVNASPFPTIDLAVADNGNWLGGNANGALPESTNDAVSFILNGTALAAIDLESAFRDGFTNGTLAYTSRFQQVNAGAGSDKLYGGTCCDNPDTDPNPVPVPGTLVLLGLGLTGLGWSRRKKA